MLTSRVFGDQPFTNPTALDIVERGASRLANPDMFKEKPLVRAALLDKVGHVYLSLGEGTHPARRPSRQPAQRRIFVGPKLTNNC